jgi:hypothetical protein
MDAGWRRAARDVAVVRRRLEIDATICGRRPDGS